MSDELELYTVTLIGVECGSIHVQVVMAHCAVCAERGTRLTACKRSGFCDADDPMGEFVFLCAGVRRGNHAELLTKALGYEDDALIDNEDRSLTTITEVLH